MFEPKALRPEAWWRTLFSITKDSRASRHWIVPDKILAEHGPRGVDFYLEGPAHKHYIGFVKSIPLVTGQIIDGPWMADFDALVSDRDEADRQVRASKDADFKAAVRDYAATRIDE